ncbi:hypothetical protein [Mycoplasmopsis verecunda]|uniref:Replicative DNA helicase loader DnaB n=1 Tax=Mycoplasmopsis verecunda TaxID=171291 RepID=A0A1T4KD83_9BACT|nr:hypothetical protein [Mycoplasmopsis verecunda]WPB54860.1 hypothetical protein SAM46_01745 [Mycoplasmopsis verecunda]SJZ40392.1 replicative DNA helicase loader DnaB [Mycoplasmopsis verecunda]
MDLQYSYFAIEKNTEITNDDLVNFREFYGPFLGAQPIFLYQYLLDFVRDTSFKRFTYDYFSLTVFLSMDLESLSTARRQLEACGLINTYADHNKQIIIFSLQKPLNAFGVKNNQLITDLLKNRIGVENFNNMIISKTRTTTYKDSYNVEDVSADFFTEFVGQYSMNQNVNANAFINDAIRMGKIRKNQLSSQNKFDAFSATKLEIGRIQYSNEYEAILKLDSLSFAQQLINSELDSNYVATLQQWQDKVQDDKIINLILFLSFYHSSRQEGRPVREWFKQAGSMINEIIQMNLSDFNTVENYFDGKIKNTYDLKVFQKKEILKSMLK